MFTRPGTRKSSLNGACSIATSDYQHPFHAFSQKCFLHSSTSSKCGFGRLMLLHIQIDESQLASIVLFSWPISQIPCKNDNFFAGERRYSHFHTRRLVRINRYPCKIDLVFIYLVYVKQLFATMTPQNH